MVLFLLALTVHLLLSLAGILEAPESVSPPAADLGGEVAPVNEAVADPALAEAVAEIRQRLILLKAEAVSEDATLLAAMTAVDTVAVELTTVRTERASLQRSSEALTVRHDLTARRAVTDLGAEVERDELIAELANANRRLDHLDQRLRTLSANSTLAEQLVAESRMKLARIAADRLDLEGRLVRLQAGSTVVRSDPATGPEGG